MSDDEQQSGGSPPHRRERNWLELIAGGIGLLLAVALIGTIGYQAVTGNKGAAPEIRLKVSPAKSVGQLYLVEIEARNLSEATAQQVEVEARLTGAGKEPEKAKLTFDYVPGGSKVKGGLFFSNDPRAGSLDVRPLGYSQP